MKHVRANKTSKYIYINFQFKCCGVESGVEYNNTVPGFNTTYVYENGGSYTTATAYIPLTCCQFSDTSKFPNDITGFITTMTNKQCPIAGVDSYMNTVSTKVLV